MQPPIDPALLEGDFVPLSPRRIVDSRDGTGGRSRPLGPNDSMTVTVPGLAASDVTAVVVNVTAVNATTASFLTAHPHGHAKPFASNLNTTPARPVSSLVTVGVSDAGEFDVANRHGSADCVVDLMGYFTNSSASRFRPLVPARLLDTRPGGVGHRGPVAGGQIIGNPGSCLCHSCASLGNSIMADDRLPLFQQSLHHGTAHGTTAYDSDHGLSLRSLLQGEWQYKMSFAGS